eukprot:scaffold7906_cov30-Tisochrysis_lutea.AAC.5
MPLSMHWGLGSIPRSRAPPRAHVPFFKIRERRSLRPHFKLPLGQLITPIAPHSSRRTIISFASLRVH